MRKLREIPQETFIVFGVAALWTRGAPEHLHELAVAVRVGVTYFYASQELLLTSPFLDGTFM